MSATIISAEAAAVPSNAHWFRVCIMAKNPGNPTTMMRKMIASILPMFHLLKLFRERGAEHTSSHLDCFKIFRARRGV